LDAEQSVLALTPPIEQAVDSDLVALREACASVQSLRRQHLDGRRHAQVFKTTFS